MEDRNFWTEGLPHHLGRRLNRRAAIRLGALAGTSALAAACGGEKKKDEQTGAATPPPPETGEAKYGGTLNLGFSEDPLGFEFHTRAYGQVTKPQMLAYNGLIKHEEPNEYAKFEIVPDLAERWEQPDQLTYIFYLHKGIKWQNVPPVNGREFTAEDVRWNFLRQTTNTPQFLNRSLYADVEDWQVVDPYTFRIKMARPNFAFLMQLANPLSIIGNRELVERDGTMDKTMVGTGPFILKEWVRGSHIKFIKNPDYFRKGRPYVDEVNVRILVDPSARLAALRARATDIDDVPVFQLAEFKRTNPDVHIDEYPGNVHWFQAMNCVRGPTQDKRVRKAIQLAEDYAAYINVMADGKGKRNPMLIWWQKPYVFPESEAPQLDLRAAKQFLTAAGYPDGGLQIRALNSSQSGPGTPTQMWELTKEHLKAIGIDLVIEQVEPAVQTQRYSIEIVFTQLTKPDMLALRAGREDVADLRLVVGHDHAIDQQQEELALLIKGGTAEPLLDPLAEGVQ